MDIIKIPVEFKKMTPTATDHKKMIVAGPLKFSCDCGNTSILNFEGIIFKQMDFYCSDCGLHYKITNPAFVPPAPTKKR